MSKRIRILFLLFYFSVSGLSLASQDFQEEMDRVMDHFTKLEFFSGTVLAAHEGKVLYAKAFGEADKDFHIPNTLDTRFELGSISKLFTGIAFMQLVEKGRVALDDPVVKHLPDFPFGDKITILHLLTHTSGLPDWTSHRSFRSTWTQVKTIEQMVPLIFNQKLKHETPGEKFQYNSSGFILMGAILEKEYGKSFAAVIKETILDPLGMKETSIANPENVVEKRAQGYVKSATGRFSANVYWLLPYVASAGIQSTVGDMLKLDQALYGEKLLSQETLAKMYQPFLEDNWGILWRLDEAYGNKVAYHGGEAPGVSAMFRRYLKDKYTIIILSNYHRAGRPLTAVVEPLLFGDSYELPKPTISEFVFQQMAENGIENTVKNFDSLMKQAGYSLDSDNPLNNLGYELLDDERMDMAVEVFKLNCRLFPEEPNTYDSLAEAYLKARDPESAVKYYQKALELNPKLGSAKVGLKKAEKLLKK